MANVKKQHLRFWDLRNYFGIKQALKGDCPTVYGFNKNSLPENENFERFRLQNYLKFIVTKFYQFNDNNITQNHPRMLKPTPKTSNTHTINMADLTPNFRLKSNLRVRTQPIYQSMHHQQYKSKDKKTGQSRSRDQSHHLPLLSRMRSSNDRHHLRSNSSSEYRPGYEADSHDETMETLNECEAILENLKRLTKVHRKSNTRRQEYEIVPATYNRQEEEEGNGRRDSQRFSSFFQFKKENKYADREVLRVRVIQPQTTHYLQEKLRKLSNKRQQKRIQQINDSSQQLCQCNQFQQTSRNKQPKQQSTETMRQGQANNKRQKLIIKYLGRAKLGGINLHERLMQFKAKHRVSIIPVPQKAGQASTPAQKQTKYLKNQI